MLLFSSMTTATKPALRLLIDGAHDGTFNMESDEHLFREHIQEQNEGAVLRFYRFNEPTLTIGYGMWRAAKGAVNGSIPAVRRLTGGGIVSHTPKDLTYSLITCLEVHPSLRNAQDSYRLIHEALQKSFQSLGFNADLYQTCDSDCKQEKISYCFDSPVLHDVMLGKKKIAGAGQKRSFGYLLQQGSIAWEVIRQARPELSESEFCVTFAEQLSHLFKLSVHHG